ncbi:Uma2 family endonuclease [Rhodopirellula sp. JC639]|uniref:Uma2 family endonuclease n=1 Tax=Stieleria mannarensis TaxID=2755585 RepID=UPI001601F752|nr:Uma2 family endonuclease [Rhodopirellula sp. JC639]
MSTAPRYIPHYTLEDYAQWEGDWELIDGVAIAMGPSPFGPHERVISRLSFQIQTQIQQHRCPCEVYTNLDWIIADDTVIRPDLMVVCGDQPEKHLQRSPDLVVEVLSDSTRGRDLTAKRTLCRENNVPHYLIIDPTDKTIEHVTDAGSDRPRLDRALDLSLATADCQLTIDPQRLFD